MALADRYCKHWGWSMAWRCAQGSEEARFDGERVRAGAGMVQPLPRSKSPM